MASAFILYFKSKLTTLSAPCFVLVNTSAVLIAGFFNTSINNAFLLFLSTKYTDWSIISTVDDTGVTVTFSG
jgi:hypothetical protein